MKFRLKYKNCFQKILFVFLGLLLGNSIYSQVSTATIRRAYAYIDTKQYNEAIDLFQSIQDSSSSQLNELETTYMIGLCEYWLGDTLSARIKFEYILSYQFDYSKVVWNNKRKFDPRKDGPDIQYKHWASKQMSNLSLEKKDYVKALFYTGQMDTVYSYRHFCGNEIEANQISLACHYADSYLGLGLIDSAINILVPKMIYGGFADNSNAVDRLIVALKQKYGLEQTRILFNDAKEGMTLKREKNGKYFWTYGEIIFLNHKLDFYTTNNLLYYETKKTMRSDDVWKKELMQEFEKSKVYQKAMLD